MLRRKQQKKNKEMAGKEMETMGTVIGRLPNEFVNEVNKCNDVAVLKNMIHSSIIGDRRVLINARIQNLNPLVI